MFDESAVNEAFQAVLRDDALARIVFDTARAMGFCDEARVLKAIVVEMAKRHVETVRQMEAQPPAPIWISVGKGE